MIKNPCLNDKSETVSTAVTVFQFTKVIPHGWCQWVPAISISSTANQIDDNSPEVLRDCLCLVVVASHWVSSRHDGRPCWQTVNSQHQLLPVSSWPINNNILVDGKIRLLCYSSSSRSKVITLINQWVYFKLKTLTTHKGRGRQTKKQKHK